jgi:hemerythrin-like domain-containing protein
MGCKQSKTISQPSDSAVPISTTVKVSPDGGRPIVSGRSSNPKPFRVMVFAFMRNAHEGVRGWLATAVEDAIAAAATGRRNDLVLCAKAQESLKVLLALIAVHMEQEDKVFFDVLDREFDDVATQEGLRDEHVDDLVMQANLKKLAAKIGGALSTTSDRKAYSECMQSFAKHHTQHLQHEEAIMMPLMSRIEPAARRPRIVHEIISCNWEKHCDLLVRRVVEQLVIRNPYGTLRMFVAATQRCMTEDQYAHVLPGLKEAAGSTWAKLAADGLGGPGQFVE